MPIGYLSMFFATISMLSGRFTGKQKNIGNILNIIISVSSGVLDYLFGNHSAVLTYPVTFLVAFLATYNWSRGIQIRQKDKYIYLIFISTILLAFALVHLGFFLFDGIEGFYFRNTETFAKQ